MAKNPYTLLGVPKSATDADIRKAYRALAKKLHPDVNPNDKKAAERFKEISAAYTLLSDKNLRAQYDSGQVDASGQAQNPFAGGFGRGSSAGNPFGGQAGTSAGGFDDMSDLFSSLFGMNMGAQTGGPRRQGYGGQRAQMTPKPGSDVRYKLTLSFFDALKGGHKRLKIGGDDAIKVTIPEGVVDGAVLRLRGKGRPGQNGGRRGDAKVEITVKPHKYFSRDGQNLRLTLPIALHEAVLGAKVTIPMPGGDVVMNIPAGTNSGQTLRLKGKGVAGGDLYVSPQITLTDDNMQSLQSWAEAHENTDASALRDRLNL